MSVSKRMLVLLKFGIRFIIAVLDRYQQTEEGGDSCELIS